MEISSDWGEKLGVDTVSDLNDQIRKGRFNELVLVQEALQERRISEIASEIVSRGKVKFVMIAGPSSSGKNLFFTQIVCTASDTWSDTTPNWCR